MDSEQRNKIKDLEKRILSLQKMADSASGKEGMILALNQKVQNAEQERDKLRDDLDGTRSQLDIMKVQAGELIDKFRVEQEAKAYLIDKRMITGFMVQFLNPKATPSTRKSMLDAMSKILNFTESER